MNNSIPERDWKYLRDLKDEMLAELCGRINRESATILLRPEGSEHEKYLALWKHLHMWDEIVGACFNDWRRSAILYQIPILREQGLLTDEHVRGLSQETQDLLARLEELGRG